MQALTAGAVAGIVVDTSLFPLETIKTRLQSKQGFLASGGFKNVYKGLSPQLVGSAPSAALFFLVYESTKKIGEKYTNASYFPFVHILAATQAELACCIVKVPVEIVKQRRQTLQLNYQKKSGALLLYDACRTEGIKRGLFRGFSSTVLRDLPFSVIQLPVWEKSKTLYCLYIKNGQACSAPEVALCGALAGGIAGGLTTPMDVIKTRIILANERSTDFELKIASMARQIFQERGIAGFFAGFVPRVLWITVGGAIFFGTYDYTFRLFS